MEIIKIDEIVIRADENGRYRLNDLHKASRHVDNASKNPSNWTRLQSTQDYVEYLNSLNFEQNAKMRSGTKSKTYALETMNGGNYPGVYACKELVYAYAMWLSHEFHTKVIHTFDAVMRGDADILKDVVGIDKYNELVDSLQESQERAEAMRLTGGGTSTFTHVAQKLGMSRWVIVEWLLMCEWIERNVNGTLIGTTLGIGCGFVSHYGERGYEPQARMTRKGVDALEEAITECLHE